MRGRRWCFTLNNYSQEDEQRLALLSSNVRYLVYGRETGQSGTPHLQGFVILNNPASLAATKTRIGESAHLELARGTSNQAADYCKKDGDVVEFGELSEQGKRSDWDRYKDWVSELGKVPSKIEIVREFPSMWARYRRACVEYAEAITPPPKLTDSEPRFGWQTRVAGVMEAEPDSRTIHFVVDPSGNSGKTWMCCYALTKFPERCQILKIGKRDDMAHVIDIDKNLVLVDVPRGQMTFLQYSVLESLKDRLVFSPKYDSALKIMRTKVTVIVFSNEHPNMDVLTMDRYKIIEI